MLTVTIGDSTPLIVPLSWAAQDFVPGEDWHLISTAKRSLSDEDADAVWQKATGAGITVSGAVATIALVPADTDSEGAAILEMDVQAQNITTGEVRTVARDRVQLRRDVTRSTSISVPIHTTEPAALPTPAQVVAALQAMDSAQSAALLSTILALLGAPSYASLAAANAALPIGTLFFNTADSALQITTA